MNKKVKKYLKILITIIIVGLFIWFIILSPWLKFKNYEKQMKEAGKRYFEINHSELPTGNRVKTITLQDLYYKSYIKEDFYIPYTKNACSIKDSWVKVKKEANGEYGYYVYLKCGVISSKIDHEGPTITLNGKKEITLNKGENYQDEGIKSVRDQTDGEMKISDVTIKSNVNTSEVGIYKVTYTALDSLNNKTQITRTIKVVQPLKNAVKEQTQQADYYVGSNPNNYIYFSGMLFRIVGLDGDDVKIIADEDIANVNYEGIEKWLDDYYYNHLTEKAKKLIVKNKYCNMDLTDTTLDTTECTTYTKERNLYIISAEDINKASANDGNYLKPTTMSWIANKKDKDNAYLTRDRFYDDAYGKNFITENIENNYGVRPVITIKGDTLIKTGDGTEDNPYTLGEFTYGKANDLINTRYSGEYINYSGMLWRIIETESDGTTKIISNETLSDDYDKITVLSDDNYDDNTKQYNPKEKGNVGYYINNNAGEYVETKYFVNHTIEVPIYSSKIKYKEETTTKKYKVKLSAPNMYEMFSAYTTHTTHMGLKSHWLINSGKKDNRIGAMTDIGVIVNEPIGEYDKYGIRVVAYLNKNISISNGKGTEEKPYIIAK